MRMNSILHGIPCEMSFQGDHLGIVERCDRLFNQQQGPRRTLVVLLLGAETHLTDDLLEEPHDLAPHAVERIERLFAGFNHVTIRLDMGVEELQAFGGVFVDQGGAVAGATGE